MNDWWLRMMNMNQFIDVYSWLGPAKTLENQRIMKVNSFPFIKMNRFSTHSYRV